MSSSSDNDAAAIATLFSKYGWDEDLLRVSCRASAKEIIGCNRIFVVSHPRHRSSGFCVENDIASMALCHLPARQQTQCGDIIVCVSPPLPDGNRVLVGWFMVTDRVDVVNYHKKFPTRADAIYMPRVVKHTTVGTKRGDVSSIKRVTGRAKGSCCWSVKYNGGHVIHYHLKHNARYHRTSSQPHARTKKWIGARTFTERKRDFRADVLLSTCFWRSGSVRDTHMTVPGKFSKRWQGRLRGGVFEPNVAFGTWLASLYQ
jgi:hypothetical protein